MSKELTGYSFLDKPWLDSYPEKSYEEVMKDIDKKMFAFMHDKNINYGDNIAISYFNQKITYKELQENIQKMAKILLGYGIRKGDIVSLCLPNIPETVYLKYALNMIGATANMIEPRHSSESIVSYVNNSKSKLLFVILDACPKKIDPIVDKLNVSDIVILTPSDSLKNNETIVSPEVQLLYAYKKICYYLKNSHISSKYSFLGDFSKWGDKITDVLGVPYSENEAATIVYTSGTTGLSKGAVLTDRAYNAMHNQLQLVADFKKGDVFFGAIPFFSAYGSFCGMHNSLCSTQEIRLVPKFNPLKVADSIIKYKPNVAFLVPGYWENVIADEKSKKEDFSYLKIIVAGGDKMSPTSICKVNEFFHEHNDPNNVRVGYGASEFGGAVAVMPASGKNYVPGSTGIVLPSCNAAIINPDTCEPLKYDEVGEICISGPTMMREYNGELEETNKLIVYLNGEKFYRTGDEGFIDANGLITVIDRYKRAMMRPDGHTVHATPIENRILEYPEIEKCCVVGIKRGTKTGSIPTAFIVAKRENIDQQFIDELDHFCLGKLSERERAAAYVVIDEMPYNLMGKIDYRKLEQYNMDELDPFIVDDTFLKEYKKDVKKRIRKE